ncbi:hypothetical protein [Azospirillum sp. Marseille-Q6669]
MSAKFKPLIAMPDGWKDTQPSTMEERFVWLGLFMQLPDATNGHDRVMHVYASHYNAEHGHYALLAETVCRKARVSDKVRRQAINLAKAAGMFWDEHRGGRSSVYGLRWPQPANPAATPDTASAPPPGHSVLPTPGHGVRPSPDTVSSPPRRRRPPTPDKASGHYIEILQEGVTESALQEEDLSFTAGEVASLPSPADTSLNPGEEADQFPAGNPDTPPAAPEADSLFRRLMDAPPVEPLPSGIAVRSLALSANSPAEAATRSAALADARAIVASMPGAQRIASARQAAAALGVSDIDPDDTDQLAECVALRIVRNAT